MISTISRLQLKHSSLDGTHFSPLFRLQKIFLPPFSHDERFNSHSNYQWESDGVSWDFEETNKKEMKTQQQTEHMSCSF